MERKLRMRMRIEVVLAIIGAALFILTLVWDEWIEEIFGVEPDGGNGEFEWLIAVGFLVAAVVFGLLARRSQHKLRTLTTAAT